MSRDLDYKDTWRGDFPRSNANAASQHCNESLIRQVKDLEKIAADSNAEVLRLKIVLKAKEQEIQTLKNLFEETCQKIETY